MISPATITHVADFDLDIISDSGSSLELFWRGRTLPLAILSLLLVLVFIVVLQKSV